MKITVENIEYNVAGHSDIKSTLIDAGYSMLDIDNMQAYRHMGNGNYICANIIVICGK